MENNAPGIRRLLSRFRAALALCVLLAGLSLALLSNGRDGFGWAFVNELALFAAAGVAVPFYYDLFLRDAERQTFLQELAGVIDERAPAVNGGRGLTVHAEGRLAPTEKADFLEGAQGEIVEVGVALRSLTSLFISRPARDFTEPVRRLLSRGVRITYLVADPESALTIEYARSIGDPDLPARAAESARQLAGVARDFAAEGHPGRMEVRFTRQLPTCYLSLVDPDLDTGRCRTSPYLAGVRRAESPVLDIVRAHQPQLFERYVAHVRHAQDDSRPVDADA
ncbi:hypothetical protein [Streptomyces sp. NPDC001843]|uniref:hypothetical protein n=1 Tax=Streptomyces sp. NPDC001843 TaxID=3364617 RepID=UPI003690368D